MNVVERNLTRKLTPPCITLVEGEVDVALAISHNLKAENYAVQIVDRGDEALHLLSETPPDLVILGRVMRHEGYQLSCCRSEARNSFAFADSPRAPMILL
jgi:DNA-binding response OmpR family regulator